MEALDIINYMIWADSMTFDMINELTDELISFDHGNNIKSIRARLIHLAEEHLGWFYDVNKMDWSEDYKQIAMKSNQELLDFIRLYHQKWLNYFNSKLPEYIETDEDGLKVKITPNEVAYNLANHNTYHRGQIITCLRIFGIETKITDYYWYKISKLQE